MKYDLIIGVDPGKRTGLAIWDKLHKCFKSIETVSIVRAFDIITQYAENGYLVQVRFEDARLRKWFGTAGREKLQGAGSIKRDCTIWQEFCEHHEIDFIPVAPAQQKGLTKLSHGQFKKLTGWTDRTTEHSRDAGMICYGL